MQTPPDLHIFGIRHHGPGSARALREALDAARPDIVLVEGPPDANEVLHWLAHTDMEPPVSLIIYRPDAPSRALYFPFAVFSPEYQAVCYGYAQEIPVRFMDLPQAHLLAGEGRVLPPPIDPLQKMAELAGFRNHEAWWNRLVEQRQNRTELFAAILELMHEVRREAERQQATAPVESDEGLDEQTKAARQKQRAMQAAGQLLADRREAHMRRTIRQARAEGYQRIAIVCGAWHAPALVNLAHADADDALLAALPMVEVEATWAPWTYGRLALGAGYGAGVLSPGWYHHLWEMARRDATPTQANVHWLTNVAGLLRNEGFDASSAHVIEAVRLAESLAAMRDMALPGLAELNDATQTVLCFGDAKPMLTIQKKLIVGERMGAVPADTPMTPLQRDLYERQKRLRLRPDPEKSVLNLDLRNAMHLERSHLLHRLNLLNIAWGAIVPVRGKEGTFREVWRLQWQPEFSVRVIEASIWGNTVHDAAESFARHRADETHDLATLTELLDQVILSELPETIAYVMQRIEDEASRSSDILHMMDALPPLARVVRYGSVRQTDKGAVQHVVDGLITRICLGLPNACAALNDEAAADMVERLGTVDGVITTLRNAAHLAQWRTVLQTLVDQEGIHGLLGGRTCRLLLDRAVFKVADAAQRLERALSIVAQPVMQKVAPETAPLFGVRPDNEEIYVLVQAACWVEGFLMGNDLLLLHDQTLWQMLDAWVVKLPPEHFVNVLPLLRRSFANFGKSTRTQIIERVRQAPSAERTIAEAPPAFDAQRANAVLPLLAKLVGAETQK
ncbi:MAG: DUF5682 family protein [Caldilineaceae bacterium]